ncbi:3-oxoadipate enol-lactonase [Saccharothrix violaceirubra]|uniref:3-oxoadipate enol-lactonase n=1 Tax=Saccharothrix violaceirubra TaxID=413306 RepID=A0A7W7T1Y1_9PSEU|nr:3-oxoadipate enol-lactonase [Saccharothrix violaceirubra]MBB4964766.1 3-oxoadipate enol-lactonase [Saccharothrix violaceirubra]
MRPHHTLDGPPDAPVVVLGPSLGTTTALWEPQLDALTGHFRVLRYDHRGHGGSPAATGPFRIDDLAEDVLELLDGLGIAKASYCGVSLGGMVGMWLAGHAPERVDRLALLCTTAAFATSRPWTDRAAAVRSNGTGSIASAVVSRWFTPEFRDRAPETVRAFETALSTVDDESYAGCCEALAALDLRPVLPAIEAPTVVVSGASDEATPPAWQRAIADAVPDAKLVGVPGAHLAGVESAAEVTAVLLDHLVRS